MTDSDLADKLTRRRARMLPVLAILFGSQQAMSYSMPDTMRTVDHVKVAAWLVMSIALLIALATGGGWIRSAGVRALMNDETTQAHRRTALAAGFWAAMATCVVVYAVALFHPVSGMRAVHVVMSVGIGAALLRFGTLERRALAA